MNWFKREYASFSHTVQGIKTVWHEVHFKYHVIATIAITVLGFIIGISHEAWLAQVLVCGLVLVAETLNTVAEEICNYMQPEQHIAIKRIKDMAGGAVLIASITALIIAYLIYMPFIAA